jgi:hypothetical protein
MVQNLPFAKRCALARRLGAHCCFLALVSVTSEGGKPLEQPKSIEGVKVDSHFAGKPNLHVGAPM